MIQFLRQFFEKIFQKKPITNVIEKPVADIVENPVADIVENPVADIVENPITDIVEKSVTDIVLGVDFGTTFTKICYHDQTRELTGIINFDNSADAEKAMIPSVVCIDHQGNLSIPFNQEATINACEGVRYLKMQLAGSVMFKNVDIPNPQSISINKTLKIKTLSAWFLATTILKACAWLKEHKHAELKGTRLRWSINMGIPVKTFDSKKRDVFQEVLEVAYCWASTHNAVPDSWQEIIKLYTETTKALSRKNSACHVVPEIAAASYSFLRTREARGRIYIHMDIGGGTVDGCSFHYVKDQTHHSIGFYAAKVKDLGVEAVTQRAHQANPNISEQDIKDAIVRHDKEKLPHLLKDESTGYPYKVIDLTARVVWRAWEGDLEKSANREISWEGKGGGPIIFIGGGGSRARWYLHLIMQAYINRQQQYIGPYELRPIPVPQDKEDFSNHGVREDDFYRFAVAYGLATPYEEMIKIKMLRKKVKLNEDKVPIGKNATPYEDTK